MVPHTNELASEFGAKGLSVIGVTGETEEDGREKTVTWVEDKGVEYGYAYDEGLELFRSLGLQAFPSAVLVDAFGNVVYSGHPARLDNAMVEAALEGALPAPLHAWGPELESVKSALRQGHYGPAKTAASTLDVESATPLPAYIDRLVEARLATAADLVKSLDVRAATAMLEGYEEAYAGLDDALATLGELAAALKTERGQAALAAQDRITEILEVLQTDDPTTLSVAMVEEFQAELEKVAEAFEDLAPGDAAANIVSQLPRVIQYLKDQR